MRHDRIGPEHAPRPVAAQRGGLWSAVMARLRPGARDAGPVSTAPVMPALPPSGPTAEAQGIAFHPRRAPLFRPFLPDPRPVLLAAADPAAEAPATLFLQTAGLDVMTCPSLRSALARAHGQPMGFSTLILMIDGFGGPQLVTDGLLALRRRLPHLPVILVSEEVTFHDFSPERLPLCDVTLRAPLSAPALELAMAEAPANNLVWQTRMAAMRRDDG